MNIETYPQPPFDRRLDKKTKLSETDLTKSTLNKEDKPNKDSKSNIDQRKIKHIEDIRNTILTFQLLEDKKMFLNIPLSQINQNFINIVLFGPSGSGKSSFIRTLFKSLHQTKSLPPDVYSRLTIKDSFENEGTVNFVKINLKESMSGTCGIRICDTRGHLLMNKEEKEQFKVIVNGKAKENKQITQSKSRNPLLLWEFWKEDEEVFPKEVIDDNPSLDTVPHVCLLVFDGSSDDIINPDEVEFYKDLIMTCKSKGYISIHVILTRVDILENIISVKSSKDKSELDVISIVNSIKDSQIEKVINCLGVKRSNVHFVENYLEVNEENKVDIDYHVLKALVDLINSSEEYILLHCNKNTSCFSKCVL